MNTTSVPAWLGVGWVIALLVLILCLVFIAIGKVDLVVGGLIAGVALARLFP